MDKQPVGQLPDLSSSNNDDEIMVITNSEYNQLKKEKISDLITDFTSTNENNALTKGTDGKMFVTDFGNASNITEGILPVSVLPDIPKDKLPDIEITDLPESGVTADTYAYPSSVTVNAQGMVTAISEGSPSGANANTDLSNITEAGKEVIRENSGSGFNMFDLVIKDHVLSFEESKGLSLQGTYVYKDAVTGSRYGYPDFYAKCIAEKTAGTETQTQLGEVTITTYNNSNGHIFYDIADKSTIDTYFESTGEAWFYGIDTTNERIFLPRTTRFQYTNDTSKVGEYQEAGLPNVEGEISTGTDGTTYTGAFGQKRFNQRLYGAGTNAGQGLTFNASSSNPIYGNSDTVTPAATNMLLYMVVGNTAEVQSTTVELTTDSAIAPIGFDSSTGAVKLNYADGLSLDSEGNLTSLTNLQAAHASMPGNKSDELTLLPTLGTYTAPADGYYSIGVIVTSAQSFITLEINPVDNDNNAQKLRAYAHGAGNGEWISVFVPVSKGDTARVQYKDVSSTFLCKFVYAQGAA